MSKSMIECHNHDKIMDSLFDEETKQNETKESFWRWLLTKIGWLK
tara:strand:- start:102 stop:236 length:135 start_codon:yes stop_codon:yes gene_type:complete